MGDLNMYQVWHVVKNAGGVFLLVMVCVYVAGSSHSGHLLTSTSEFSRALDQVAGNIVNAVMRCFEWLFAGWR